MWITAAYFAASIGAVTWVIVARRAAVKRGETLRETLRRQWRQTSEEVPDVTPQNVKEAERLTVADELDRGEDGDAGGSHSVAGWDSDHH